MYFWYHEKKFYIYIYITLTKLNKECIDLFYNNFIENIENN